MDRRLAFIVPAASLLVAATGPAAGQTKAECEAAIEEIERALLAAPVLENAREDRRKRIEDVVAEAGAAGIAGDYARCMELVGIARGKAGLG